VTYFQDEKFQNIPFIIILGCFALQFKLKIHFISNFRTSEKCKFIMSNNLVKIHLKMNQNSGDDEQPMTVFKTITIDRLLEDISVGISMPREDLHVLVCSAETLNKLRGN
jgi:hypothetical protein